MVRKAERELMRPYLQKNDGFLLIETIIGVTILSIIVTATVSLLNKKMSTDNYTNEQFTAIALASKLAFEYRLFDVGGSPIGKHDGLEYKQDVNDKINGGLVLKTQVLAPSGVIILETYGH